MIVKTFQEIMAWQKAHELTLRAYNLTDKYPRTEIFGLTSQTRRSALSIPSNLAEEVGRLINGWIKVQK